MSQQIEPNVEMPSIRYGGVAYPVLFAAAGIKRWAEHTGQSFVEAVDGWQATALSDDDLLAMLRIVLEAGERRRRLSATDENRTIADELIADIFETYHLAELWDILTAAWNQPPGREPDPPKTAPLQTGEPSFD